MIYNVKTDNYRQFEIFKKNILSPRSYFIPFSSREELLKTDIRTERYSSSMVTVLSGEWEFKYYNKRSDMPENIDSSSFGADIINVPSCWQFTGYEKPYYVNSRFQFKCNPPYFPEDCPVGVYLKKFSIDSADGSFILSFLGVAPCVDVFINGRFVGYSEGSHNTAEFEITDYINSGENELLAVVHKWCNGTYLECQDMFRNNGIFRDVLITKTGKNSVYDFDLKTTFNTDGKYTLDIIPSLKISDNAAFSAQLFDGECLVSEKSVNIRPEKAGRITFDSLAVEEWSAEIPKLYTLYVSLTVNGELIEVIRKRIGFRHIEIENNVFLFNGKKIKLLGINHHDTDAERGYAVNAADMEKDIRLFKEYNANCVRTSHYPPDPIFIDLCDEYGLYVVDEADIECHGVNEVHRPNLIAKNPRWKEHFWDRVLRMYQRDKCHASIVMWSLGNESGGYNCHDYCYNNLKKLTDIPIHYEGACRTRRWSYDVHSEMYTSPVTCKKIAAGKGLPAKYYKKPFYLCEYAHAMGVGAGELETYVKQFYSSDIMMGGCIWEFADHAVCHGSGKYEYTYGGDHGEWKHDGNFCVDGLFFPDKSPHTGAYQMKVCYRPVRASRVSENRFEFFNHLYFKNARLCVKYRILRCGYEIKAGEIELNIAPQESQIAEIDYKSDNHTVIIFEYFEGAVLIAREQLVLNSEFAGEKQSVSSAEIAVSESESKVFVNFAGGSLIFDLKSGTLQSYIYNSKELINQLPLGSRGIAPDLYRAPLDNDMYMNKQWSKKGLAELKYKKKKSCYRVLENEIIFANSYKLMTPECRNAGSFKTIIAVNSSGELNVKYSFSSLKFRNIPRLGIQLEMPKSFCNVKYYGYDMETLSDFLEHSVYAICKLSVSDMHEKYIKPQESGMRYGTFWAELTDEDGTGLRFSNDEGFVFNANHFNSVQCAKAEHKEDLTEYNTTVVHLDGFMLGAGSNACGPKPFDEHRKYRVSKYENSFNIKPIGELNV